MRGKKKIVATAAQFTGATRLLEALPGKPALLILNYHRIGDPNLTPYDSGLFSCTTAEFDAQVAYLQQRFHLIALPEALDFIHGRAPLAQLSILLTFDDGYLDNYTEAFPVLRKHRASATFFLPTAFVGTGVLPWWDAIAFLVKHTQRPSITLTYPETRSFDLQPAARAQSIIAILNLFKQPAMTDSEKFIAELEAACGCARPTQAERCFLNWDEAREMQAGGMFFGSHTHTHELLARLPFAEQLEEVQTSRAILESELRTCIDTLAYPVGKANTFSAQTIEALRAAAYTTAFSFKGGINLPQAVAPFDVARVAVDPEARSIFRLRVASLAGLGRSIV